MSELCQTNQPMCGPVSRPCNPNAVSQARAGRQETELTPFKNGGEQPLMTYRNRPTRAPDNAKDLWILGAGFSRQLHDGMPLMSDLAESVRDIIADRFDNPLVLNDVELALSELQSDAPWKSPVDRHADLALYEMMVERIREQLQIPSYISQDGHGNILAHEPYASMNGDIGQRLVNTWHINGNHVLTFNFDLLVEALAETIRCQRYRDDDNPQSAYFIVPRHIYPIPIPHVRTRNGGVWSGQLDAITFSYYKLHGSLNYYTNPEPFQNTAMYHRHHGEVEDLAKGLKTFIVPPANNKQTFIEHPVLQAIWTKAVEELANNDRGRIIMIGYSLPQTDLTVLSMLRSAIRSNYIDGVAWPKILVVNPDPDAAPHIKKLLGVPNPVGQVTDVAGFLEVYAPPEFIRSHVWDNVHKEESMRDQEIYLSRGDSYSRDDASYVFELHDEDRKQGRRGLYWFLSQEESLNWRQSVHQQIPVNRWL